MDAAVYGIRWLAGRGRGSDIILRFVWEPVWGDVQFVVWEHSGAGQHQRRADFCELIADDHGGESGPADNQCRSERECGAASGMDQVFEWMDIEGAWGERDGAGGG